jgi:hypothetical protein
VDGILQEHQVEVTATLSPGLHTVTLWIDDVGISVPVLVRKRIEPLQQVGVITGWSGTPAVMRYDGQSVRLLPGFTLADYSVAQLAIYDVDRLVLGEGDVLRMRLLSNGQEVRYSSVDDGKFINRFGIPYEQGEQDE